MSKKQWLALLMLFLFYLLFGASIFHHIESDLEREKLMIARNERIEINGESFEFKCPRSDRVYWNLIEDYRTFFK